MNKLDIFLSKHGTKIILVLLLLTFLKSCGASSELNKVKKELKKVQTTLESVPNRKDLVAAQQGIGTV